jgi:hypothetical protein
LPDVKALKPAFIRLDHIFDFYDVVNRTNGQLVFDFSRLDASVDTIVQAGATPVLSLSYMPQVLARDGSVTSEPANWAEWSEVVRATVEHYSSRDKRNMSNVYYEVWNEPDLFGNWKIGSGKKYLDLYRYAVLGANLAINTNNFYIGGPATTGFYPNWIEELFKSDLRLDFISWHVYTSDIGQFSKNEEILTSIIARYPKYSNIKRFISEFGFESDKDDKYDSQYASAYTLGVFRTFLDLQTAPFVFELRDGPADFGKSGWGLIPYEGNMKRIKPRYQIFIFLDKLEGSNQLSVSGEGTWTTAWAGLNNGAMRILLNNFDPEETHVENVPVNVINLENGEYLLTTNFLDGRKISVNITVIENKFTKNIYLGVNSSVLLEFVKK